MYLEVSERFMDDIRRNTFLRNKCKEFSEHKEEKSRTKFLNENPDFVQMLLHLSSSDEIKVIYENDE